MALAQSAPPFSARWWPTAVETEGARLSAFGNVITCMPGECSHAGGFGLDAAVAGRLRVGIDARLPGLDYGLSYGWRNIGIAASVGRGASGFRPPLVSRAQSTISFVDSLNRVHVDTVGPLPYQDSSAHDAIRWSSAEARLTWRENRWWATALVGRVAVAQQAAALWMGGQLGIDIGRGASLLLGAGTTPRVLELVSAPPRHTVSLGLGFNAAILSARPNDATAKAKDSHAVFVVSSIGTERVRIMIRLPAAHSLVFASDCTDWTPLDMTRTADGWIVDVKASRGLHRANVRVDGGAWVAPPGLASITDDFAGEVGLFAVE
jgi:hypothetical protein